LRHVTKGRVIAVLKAAIYIIMNFRQIQVDMIKARAAVEDWQITKEEAQDIRERLDKHMKGLGLE
jgi:hypothetical protein